MTGRRKPRPGWAGPELDTEGLAPAPRPPGREPGSLLITTTLHAANPARVGGLARFARLAGLANPKWLDLGGTGITGAGPRDLPGLRKVIALCSQVRTGQAVAINDPLCANT